MNATEMHLKSEYLAKVLVLRPMENELVPSLN